MAWGILMTFLTLFGMMVLAIREATTSETSEWSAQDSSEKVAQERPSTEKPELPKAA